jgi:hypothetical protein
MASKNIIAIAEDGSYKKLSLQEIRASKLNTWKDWYCSVGQLNISIDENGDMIGGDCGVGGYLGNVYNNIQLSNKWHKCTIDYCSCMFDIPVLKVKEEKYINIKKSDLQNIDNKFVYFKGNTDILRFEWFLSSKCNYECSYCPENFHNKLPHKNSYEKILIGINNLNNLNIKYNISFWGGEPTLFPNYIDICKIIVEKGNSVFTVTNGSRSSTFFKKLIHYSSLNISLHQEFLNTENMIKNLKTILQEIENNNLTNWVMIRCMVKPGSLSYWNNFIKILKNEIPNFENKLKVTLNTLVYKTESNLDFTKSIQDYSEKEIQILTKFGRLTDL